MRPALAHLTGQDNRSSPSPPGNRSILPLPVSVAGAAAGARYIFRAEIPGDGGSVSRIVYIVQPGNDLEDVAELFGVTGSDIKSWNGLRGSRLETGQKLTIHPPAATEKHTYKVRRGDTLTEIAQPAPRDGREPHDRQRAAVERSAGGQQLVAYTPG